MNAKKIMAALGLLAMSLTATAGDVESVTIKGTSGVTRAEVKAELQKAFANGEIVHGDLVVLHELLAPAKESAKVAQSASVAVAAR